MLRVICEDLLYHETPVAMSSVVCMNIRRIVMRPHVQRMLHNLAVGHRSAFTRLSLPFSGPSRNSYSLCCAAVVRRSTLWAKLSSDLGSRQVLSTGCRLFLCACGSWFLFFSLFSFFVFVCLFFLTLYFCPDLSRFGTESKTLTQNSQILPRSCPVPACEARSSELFVRSGARHLGSELRNKLRILRVSS